MTVYVPSEAMEAYLKNAVKVADALASNRKRTELVFISHETVRRLEEKK